MQPAFEVKLQKEAVAQLEALDPDVRSQIRRKLIWLGDHAEEIRHLPLHRDLAGLYKRRVGSYRVVYELVTTRRIIVVHKIGHRRDVYMSK